MSKFGMQTTASRAKRAASPDVYTVMAVVACLFLAGATFVMFHYATKVGVGGNPFGIQTDTINLKK